MADGRPQQVETALYDLQRYLSDEIPPITAADAVALLMAQPPEVMMQQIGAWSVEQSRMQPVAVSDLLLHALKKVYITGELKLLDREAVANYLDRATTIAIRVCPDEERAVLRANLTAMRSSRTISSARVEIPVSPIRFPTSSGRVPVVADDEAQNTKRLSLIMDRLGRTLGSGGGPAITQADPQALAQILTMAASSSKTGQQFNDYVEQIQHLTGGKEGNVFVILGGGLPSWDIPNVTPGAQKPPAQIDAMEKIIELAEDPGVVMQRVQELVTAATAKFNDGSLAAAVWMFDVATDTIAERKLDPAAVDRIRADAVGALNHVQLRKYAETKRKHGALRIALEFFPTLRLDSVFQQLRGEERPERRRSLLGLIEIYGAAGRDLALAELDPELQRPDIDTYYLRNLIYLLHRIPRESDEGIEQELDGLAKASARGQNIYVVKEAVTALGQIRTEASVRLLTTRLAEFEAVLLRGDASMYPIAEMQKLLDRIISGIARIGTPTALLTVARHGMNANPLLGDTRARLATLAQYDLSFDEATVEVLLKALREEIPRKLLGRLLPKRQDSTVRLIEALSSTRSETAEEVVRDIAQRFPDQEIGRAAAESLEKRTAARQPARPETAATFSGELEFFGLPSVLQSLAEMRATGMLTLSTKQGQAAAKLVVVEGKFLNAQKNHIRGTDALYEILERPIAGTFAFVPHPVERMKSPIEPQAVMGLLLEGCRRHDELQGMMALVPDDMTLTKTNVKPAPHEDEDDPALVREVWLHASSGKSIREWESQVPTDSYRIRRLVAHWLELGSLVGK